MSQSVLLSIARRSIEEVLQAENTIEHAQLLAEYPVLGEKMATQVNLYMGGELRGSARSDTPSRPLLDDIIRNAKIAAFQDENFPPLVTSEYLRTSVELILFSTDGPLRHRDTPILQEG
ncbi:MAG: AMMECR1 domain-containing protein [Campylobacterales bacterium]|nr:AMMECR1 domain-containing protein [Campylobacterales bacterium]